MQSTIPGQRDFWSVSANSEMATNELSWGKALVCRLAHGLWVQGDVTAPFNQAFQTTTGRCIVRFIGFRRVSVKKPTKPLCQHLSSFPHSLHPISSPLTFTPTHASAGFNSSKPADVWRGFGERHERDERRGTTEMNS